MVKCVHYMWHVGMLTQIYQVEWSLNVTSMWPECNFKDKPIPSECYLGQKIFFGQKNIWSKKFGVNNIWVKKVFRLKNIWGQK